MKKPIILLLMLLPFAWTGCDKNDDHEASLITQVTITNAELVSSSISEVALVARVHMPAGAGAETTGATSIPSSYITTPVPFNPDGMTLIFPEAPPQSLLRPIESDIPKGFEISDRSANTIAFIEIGGYTSGNERMLGSFSLQKGMGNESFEITYIYCDRPAWVTGSGNDWWGKPTTYNLRLEKGWNQVVERTVIRNTEQIITITNSTPSGLRWQYNMWI